MRIQVILSNEGCLLCSLKQRFFVKTVNLCCSLILSAFHSDINLCILGLTI